MRGFFISSTFLHGVRAPLLAFLILAMVLLAAVGAFFLLGAGKPTPGDGAPPPDDLPGEDPPSGEAPSDGPPTEGPLPWILKPLPSARNGAAGVWADGKAYVFGGHGPGGLLDEVVAYDPASGDAAVVARLPEPLFTSAAVWTGEAVYLFGGSADGGGTGLTDVLRFDPATRRVEKVADLPARTMAASAAWDPRPTPACPRGCAYVLGGSAAIGTYSRDVVRFDPATRASTPMGPVLPVAHRLGAAVWTGDAAYVLGGYDGAPLDQVVRYDPVRNEAVTTKARLPNATHGAVAVAHDGKVHLLGGSDDLVDLGRVVVLDPARDAVETRPTGLACATAYAASAWDGARLLLLGGREGGPLSGLPLEVVQLYDPGTGAAAASGPC